MESDIIQFFVYNSISARLATPGIVVVGGGLIDYHPPASTQKVFDPTIANLNIHDYSTMAAYESDSSDGDYTETSVLLGYTSKDADEETISRLGGLPVRGPV